MLVRVVGKAAELVQAPLDWPSQAAPRGVLALNEPLAQLLDAKHLAAELGITRAAAEKMMQALPIVQVPGLRKTYVRRPDVERLLEACTFTKDQVPA
jgi:hypothetical protein